jgi:putative glycosyltransferase (TIGR04372 family)
MYLTAKTVTRSYLVRAAGEFSLLFLNSLMKKINFIDLRYFGEALPDVINLFYRLHFLKRKDLTFVRNSSQNSLLEEWMMAHKNKHPSFYSPVESGDKTISGERKKVISTGSDNSLIRFVSDVHRYTRQFNTEQIDGSDYREKIFRKYNNLCQLDGQFSLLNTYKRRQDAVEILRGIDKCILLYDNNYEWKRSAYSGGDRDVEWSSLKDKNWLRWTEVLDIKKTVEYLLSSGYSVFRMGRPGEHLPIAHENYYEPFLDPALKKHIDFYDFYIPSRSEFAISFGSGGLAAASVFGLPVLSVNTFNYFNIWALDNAICLPLRFVNEEFEEIGWSEIDRMQSIGTHYDREHYQKKKLNVARTRVEDICTAIRDLISRLYYDEGEKRNRIAFSSRQKEWTYFRVKQSQKIRRLRRFSGRDAGFKRDVSVASSLLKDNADWLWT